MSGTMVPQGDEVKVRMYRQGLGDCFLMAFPGTAGDPQYVMIDCGLITGAPDRQRIKKVVTDIKKATGGSLHILIVTHEHWDHVSGFLEAETEFEALSIHNLWLAWTEDTRNTLANGLRTEREQKVEALREALKKRKEKEAKDPVAGLVGFFLDLDNEALGAAAGRSTKDALIRARGFVEAANIQCCYPHMSQMLTGTSSVRVFFLGPPENEKLIRKINPSTVNPEVYTEEDEGGKKSHGRRRKHSLAGAMVPSSETAFMMAAHYHGDAPVSEDRELFELCCPFDRRYRLSPEHAVRIDFFKQHYGIGDEASPVPADGDESNVPVGPEWRRIDDDWLEASGELALALDSLTNNTSLAVAFELTPGGKVLLFPADAQVGNWLSWHLKNWSIVENGTTRTVTARELLTRTVLYKVGHHGSHNATMREQGLELMTSPELAAMVPVDKITAHEIKGWRRMPFDPLMLDLRSRTQGRVMQLDEPIPNEDQPPDDVDAAIWQEFRKRVDVKDLYFEYTVKF